MQIEDAEGKRCGKIDDLEFEGGIGKQLLVKALITGPGAMVKRSGGLMAFFIKKIAGEGQTSIDIKETEGISTSVKLKKKAEALGLGKLEERFSKKIERIPQI